MKTKNIFFRLFLFLYSVGLLVFVVLKFDGSFSTMTSTMDLINSNKSNGIYNANLVPFRQIGSYLGNIFYPFALKALLTNIIAFIPLGFFVKLRTESKLKGFLICLLIILSIEIFQFFTMVGFFDVDDLILNSSGAVIGIYLSQIFKLKNPIQKDGVRETF